MLTRTDGVCSSSNFPVNARRWPNVGVALMSSVDPTLYQRLVYSVSHIQHREKSRGQGAQQAASEVSHRHQRRLDAGPTLAQH